MPENYEKKTKKLASAYRKANFNKEMYGEYMLSDLLPFSVEDEDGLISEFTKSVDMLKKYPGNGYAMNEIITALYIKQPAKTLNEEARILNLSIPTVYKYANQAFEIIGKRLFG